jgi:hypothetical protein
MPQRLKRLLGVLIVFGLVCPSALAQSTTDASRGDDPMIAQATTETSSTTVTSSTEAEAEEEEEENLLPFNLSLGVSTSIGGAIFVPSEADRLSVATSFSVSASYSLGHGVTLSGGVPFSWYNYGGFGASVPDNTVLVGDPYVSISHGKIFADEDAGVTLSGSFAVYGGASLASRYQTRYITIKPGISLSWKLDPVTITYGFSFSKYFNGATNPVLDCSGYTDVSECYEGRDGLDPSMAHVGFQAEAGGEFWVPTSGTTSFYFSNSLSLNWAIIEGLSASVSASIGSAFTYLAVDIDEFSSPNARPGRLQSDSLSASIGLSYQVMKYLTANISFSSSSKPFGSKGDTLELFNVQNGITSLSVGLTASL